MFIHESTHALDKLLGRDTDSPAPDSPYGYDINIGEHNAVNEANRYRESVNEPLRLWYKWLEDYLER